MELFQNIVRQTEDQTRELQETKQQNLQHKIQLEIEKKDKEQWVKRTMEAEEQVNILQRQLKFYQELFTSGQQLPIPELDPIPAVATNDKVEPNINNDPPAEAEDAGENRWKSAQSCLEQIKSFDQSIKDKLEALSMLSH
jgi:hypothetical protein